MPASSARSLRLSEPFSPSPDLLFDRAMLRPKRARAVTEAILHEIIARGWPEGASLGTEGDLLQRLGVSRATFREAVRDLERHGVIVARRGQGLVVAAPARDTVAAALASFIRLDGGKWREVADVAGLLQEGGDAEGRSNSVVALLLEVLAPFDYPGESASSGPAAFPISGDGDKLAVATAQRIADDLEGRRVGDRLGTETNYLTTYSVGRSTLRESLALLEGHGLIVRRQGLGGGLFKGKASPRMVAETAAIYLHYLQLDAEAVLEARIRLEPEAASRAARFATREHRVALAAMLDQPTGPGSDMAERQRSFHIALADLSGNAVLSLFVQVLMQSYYLIDTSAEPEFITDCAETHRVIGRAIAAGDADAARTAMIAHLDFTRRWTQAGLLRV